MKINGLIMLHRIQLMLRLGMKNLPEHLELLKLLYLTRAFKEIERYTLLP
jgi:hypothetical protein